MSFLSPNQKALLICAICVPLSACKFFDKKSGKRKGKNIFIIESSVQFTRDEHNFKLSSLKFETKSDGACELRLLSQEMDPDVKSPDEKLVPCQSASPTKKFAEVFSDLRTDTLYSVEIHAWPAGGNRDSFEKGLFHETLAQGMGTRLNLITFNIPLHAAQVRSIALKKETRLFELYRYGRPFAGCKPKKDVPKTETFGKFDDVKLANAKLTGHLIAEKLFSSPQEALLFNNQNPNEDLTIELSSDAGVDNASFDKLGGIATFHVEGVDKKDLSKSYLNAASEQVAVNGDLKLSWEATHSSPQSYLEVEIGVTPQDKQILCYFDAMSKEATIASKDLLDSLPKGIYEVTVRYVHRQVKLFDTKLPWFITAQDWRNFRLERI